MALIPRPGPFEWLLTAASDTGQHYRWQMTDPNVTVRPVNRQDVDLVARVLANARCRCGSEGCTLSALDKTCRARGNLVPNAFTTDGRDLARAIGEVLQSSTSCHRATAFPEPTISGRCAGTHKDHKGEGLGSALMRSMLERCDNAGMPTYLESTNPANDAWYARFGFEARGPIPLPAGAPVLTAMWRDPR